MTRRPRSLKEVAEWSESLADFGRNLRDWLHELRRASSRTQVLAAIGEEPPAIRERFPQGDVADAWLGAYAEHTAQKIGRQAPAWAFAPWRISSRPLFDDEASPRALRVRALAYAPSAFKRRNIFTPNVDLPLRLRAGRPRKSLEEKRKSNADRQRRFRRARAEELEMLRKIATRRTSEHRRRRR